MPKRTTIIQKVIELIEKNNSSSFMVSGSKMLQDKDSDSEREVDVVLEGEVNNHPFIISIEVVERTRPMDQTWVEQMIAKHGALPTNKLVLVSYSGFTKPAKLKATRNNVETYDLRTEKFEFKNAVEEIATIERLELNLGLFVDGELVMPESEVTIGDKRVNVNIFLNEFAELADIPERLKESDDDAVVLRFGDSPEAVQQEECRMVVVAKLIDKKIKGVNYSVVNYQGIDYLYGAEKNNLDSTHVVQISSPSCDSSDPT